LCNQLDIKQQTATETVLSKIENCFDAFKEKKTKQVGTTKTFAETVKQQEFNPIVIVKPKTDGQESAVTEKFVKQKIDPIEVPVCGIKSVVNGGVIVRCHNKVELEKCREKIQEKLGQNYTVVAPKVKQPMLKIVGLTEMLTEDELIEKIIAQNAFLSINTKIEVAELKQKGRKIFAAVRCDGEAYKKLKEREKITIGWDRCRVYEHIQVLRCFKCAGFNHKAAECQNETACAKCAGSHELTKCDSTIEKCVNCMSVNKKFKLNIDVAHPVWSQNCQVYMKKLKNEMSKIDFS
jgi:hypothetical protein